MPAAAAAAAQRVEFSQRWIMKPGACPCDAASQQTPTAPLAAHRLRPEPAEQPASEAYVGSMCLQVITPMRKVAAGTNHLNTVLQSRLNSLSPTAGASQKSALPILSSVAGTSGATAGEKRCTRSSSWHTVCKASMCTSGSNAQTGGVLPLAVPAVLLAWARCHVRRSLYSI